MTHSEESTLESISATLKHLLTATYDLKNEAEVKFEELLDELVSQLVSALGVADAGKFLLRYRTHRYRRK